MAQKSIVDRVLMLAAGICAAALVWQLTVLLTSKGRTSPASGPVVAAVSTSPSAEPTPPAATAPAAAVATPVRVVYAGTEPSTKTSVKASDPPPPPVASVVPAAQPAAPTGPDDASSTPGGSASTDTSRVGPLALVTSPSPDFAAMPDSDADRTATTAPPPASPPSRIAVAKPEPPAIEDSSQSGSSSAGGGIDLNHASVDALNRLKGAGHIGQAIVSHRPYRSVEDLVKKRVLRRGVYEQIKQQVVTQ